MKAIISLGRTKISSHVATAKPRREAHHWPAILRGPHVTQPFNGKDWATAHVTPRILSCGFLAGGSATTRAAKKAAAEAIATTRQPEPHIVAGSAPFSPPTPAALSFSPSYVRRAQAYPAPAAQDAARPRPQAPAREPLHRHHVQRPRCVFPPSRLPTAPGPLALWVLRASSWSPSVATE